MSTAAPPPAPAEMSDTALLAAWEAFEPYDEASVPARAKAILDEIERRGLDI